MTAAGNTIKAVDFANLPGNKAQITLTLSNPASSPLSFTIDNPARIALDFPDLVIVGGHIGYPWTDEAVAVATKHTNVYIDTSAYTAGRYPQQLVRYLEAHGRHKVLFGSNYPMITPAKALGGLEQLGLDEETTELFLSANAKRVFRL